MKLPFYQTIWNSIDLRQLANEIGQPKNFDFIAKEYYSKGMNLIKVKTFMGAAVNNTPYRQMIVLKKTGKK